ncbi:MAG TPA: NADH:ubiquinone reductase (Na(+)-transporting) subunit A, partial [Spirochaetota bacterium]|nr:NADH:ubiquinone reductase (Na(+)-transporting) subunit A [Spirochaetota bacterium]
VKNPVLIRTHVGAELNDITAQQLIQDDNYRIISGSVLDGRSMNRFFAWLGRFHRQVTVLPENKKRSFLGWTFPGFRSFSLTRTVAASFLPVKRLHFTTSSQGDRRAVVPIGSYEKVMPLDIEPTFLFRSLYAGDIDQAEKLGCLELAEEDLALCTVVCPGKNDFGVMLRRMLDRIEKEG